MKRTMKRSNKIPRQQKRQNPRYPLRGGAKSFQYEPQYVFNESSESSSILQNPTKPDAFPKEKNTFFTENNQVNNLILKSDYDILIIGD